MKKTIAEIKKDNEPLFDSNRVRLFARNQDEPISDAKWEEIKNNSEDYSYRSGSVYGGMIGSRRIKKDKLLSILKD